MTLHIIMIDWSSKFIAVKIADITEIFLFLLKLQEKNERIKNNVWEIFLFGSAFVAQHRKKVWKKIKRVNCHMSDKKK